MYPFYEKDTREGRITPEEAVELIECLWIKTLEINKLRCWYHTRYTAGYPMFQVVNLGGQTKDAKSAINDLTWLALEATANLKLPSPLVQVRYWNGMPEDFLLKCCEVINIHRGGQPAMFNDEVIIPSQLAVGVTLEDAYDYAICSCIEPAQPGKSLKPGLHSGQYNMLKILELTLNNGKDPRSEVQIHSNPDNNDLTAFESFEELWQAYKAQLGYYDRLLVTGINCVARAFADLTPTPFASVLMDDCIKKGKDIEWGGARYSTGDMIQVGMSSAGNSLAALKKVVFEDRRLTAWEVKNALKTNFEDDSTTPTGEEIRQILLAAPKFGNDDDYVDLLVKEVFACAVKDMPNYTIATTGARCNTQTAVVTSHVAMGSHCDATPDGRKAGQPTNEGVSVVQGTDTSGPTATIKSVAKLDHILCADGTLFNLKFNPVSFQELEQMRRVAALIRTYFALKGMHLQFNVVSAKTLKDARLHPEKYPNLLVRVAGYSALFTTLEPAVQDEIISRTEQSWS